VGFSALTEIITLKRQQLRTVDGKKMRVALSTVSPCINVFVQPRSTNITLKQKKETASWNVWLINIISLYP
jgi:hypothetical protein